MIDADEIDAHRGYQDRHHSGLVTLKTAYDPDDAFRRNPNIRPRPAAAVA